MKKTIYKISIISIILLIIMSMITPIFANGPSFSDEAYWNRTCTTQYDDFKSSCEAYRKYRQDEIKKNEDKIKDLEGQQTNLQKDIDKVVADIAQSDKVIESIEAQIQSISEQIRFTEIRIGQIENQIITRISEIEQREIEVADIMILTQSTYRTNDYLEFIMGSQDFSEMMRRMAGVNAFKRSMDTTIEQLVIAKEDLEKDKLAVVKEKENLVQAKDLSALARQDADVILKSQKILYSALHSKQNEFLAAADSIKVKNAADKKLIDQMAPIPASTGFTRPISSNYRITHGVWTYADDSNPHYGLDFGRPSNGSIMGRPIVAAGNGIVAIAAENGCSNAGASRCGGGFGNYVTIIFNVKGTIYGALYAHMTPGSLGVSTNQEIKAGQFLGSVGNSGASFGAHVHVEVYYLGDDSVANAWDRWSGSATFDTGATGDGKRCDSYGYSYPCRLNPSNIFGVQVGGSY